MVKHPHSSGEGRESNKVGKIVEVHKGYVRTLSLYYFTMIEFDRRSKKNRAML